jgi:CubicO group peptidase (beta-lactamase class C family)
MRFPAQTQFALALIDGEALSFLGMIRTGDTLRTINNADSVFEIGSISKVFTSTLLARMAAQSRLNTQDPISAYLNFPLNDSVDISFLQLANHTSGLARLPPAVMRSAMANPDNPYQDYDREKLRNYMRKKTALQYEAGSTYEYSNLGAGMLGFVLEQHSGQSYEALLQQMICQPLQMKHTSTERSRLAGRLVEGLNPAGNVTSNWDLAALVGAGGILSTVSDLAAFVVANFESSLQGLSLQRQPTFTVNEQMEVALGWHILKRKEGRQWHWHNGGTGGYRSSMGMDVTNRKAVVLLTNMSSGHPLSGKIDQLCFTLLEQMYE